MTLQDSIWQDSARAVPVQDTVRADSALHAAQRLTSQQPADTLPASQELLFRELLRSDSVREVADSALTLPFTAPADTLFPFAGPLYVKESYFASDSLFSTSRGRDRQGVAGAPVPYTIRGDNMFTSLLLLCFIVLMVSVSNTRQFVLRQMKYFFFPTHNSRDVSETSGEVRFQSFLVVLACLLLAIVAYIYSTDRIARTYLVDDYQLVGVFFGCFVGYFLLKALLYELVNSVFFTQAQIAEWRRTALFVSALEGVLLFPIVLLLVYFDLSFENAVFYCGFVLIFVKILSFYKCSSIFFRQIGAVLQNILYFCTLEIVPLLAMAGAMGLLIDLLKITF